MFQGYRVAPRSANLFRIQIVAFEQPPDERPAYISRADNGDGLPAEYHDPILDWGFWISDFINPWQRAILNKQRRFYQV